MRHLLCMLMAAVLLAVPAGAETVIPVSPLFEATFLQNRLCRI